MSLYASVFPLKRSRRRIPVQRGTLHVMKHLMAEQSICFPCPLIIWVWPWWVGVHSGQWELAGACGFWPHMVLVLYFRHTPGFGKIHEEHVPNSRLVSRNRMSVSSSASTLTCVTLSRCCWWCEHALRLRFSWQNGKDSESPSSGQENFFRSGEWVSLGPLAFTGLQFWKMKPHSFTY